MSADAPREVGDAQFLEGSDVVNIKMLALGAHHHHALYQVVHETEAAGLGATALDGEGNRA